MTNSTAPQTSSTPDGKKGPTPYAPVPAKDAKDGKDAKDKDAVTAVPTPTTPAKGNDEVMSTPAKLS